MNFLILRYFVYCPFVTDSVNAVYEKYYHREYTPGNRGCEHPCNKILSPAEAKQIIQEQKMIKVKENEHGTVWREGGSNQNSAVYPQV